MKRSLSITIRYPLDLLAAAHKYVKKQTGQNLSKSELLKLVLTTFVDNHKLKQTSLKDSSLYLKSQWTGEPIKLEPLPPPVAVSEDIFQVDESLINQLKGENE